MDTQKCNCRITQDESGIIKVILCGAHSYGTELLQALKKMVHAFEEIEERFHINLSEGYGEMLNEANAILNKVNE